MSLILLCSYLLLQKTMGCQTFNINIQLQIQPETIKNTPEIILNKNDISSNNIITNIKSSPSPSTNSSLYEAIPSPSSSSSSSSVEPSPSSSSSVVDESVPIHPAAAVSYMNQYHPSTAVSS